MAKPDKGRQSLSIEQQNAIDMLVLGKTDREVAEAVGVSRQTVCGWRLYHPQFQAGLNLRRQAIWGTAVDKLRSLVPKSLEILERELDQADEPAKIALGILKLAGLDGARTGDLGGYMIGSSDAVAIVNAEALSRRPDPLADLLRDEPVSETERQAVLTELEAEFSASLGNATR